MINKKFILNYNCKYWFGQMVVYATNINDAKLSCKLRLEDSHPTAHNSCSKVKRDCSKLCKLKITKQ